MTTEEGTAILRQVRFANFKRFKQDTFELRPLTLLTGLNGAGKSSFIQGILLVSEEHPTLTKGTVALNGRWSLALGQIEELFTFGEEETQIEIGLTYGDMIEEKYVLERIADDPFKLQVSFRRDADPAESSSEARKVGSTAYLCAERFGPRTSLPLDLQGQGTGSVGVQGEYTAQFLDRYGGELRVSPARLHHDSLGDDEVSQVLTLRAQAEFWMRDLVPGLEVKALPMAEILQAALKFKTNNLNSNWVRPAHMGFGVSYALPIIVQGLAMKRGSLLIVENPEAHLHPAGQSAMGRFLGLLATDGIQVIVETHSDHVMNGIRLASMKDSHPLRREDVLIHFFQGSMEEEKRAIAIEIDKKGGYTQRPSGFFDQSETDLLEILRARSPAAQTERLLRDRAAQRVSDQAQDK